MILSAISAISLAAAVWFFYASLSGRLEELAGDLRRVNDRLGQLEGRAADGEKVQDWTRDWLAKIEGRLDTRASDVEARAAVARISRTLAGIGVLIGVSE